MSRFVIQQLAVSLLFKNCGNNIQSYCLQAEIIVLRFGHKSIPFGVSVNTRQWRSLGYEIFVTTCVIK